jgi:hypothetical protein
MSLDGISQRSPAQDGWQGQRWLKTHEFLAENGLLNLLGRRAIEAPGVAGAKSWPISAPDAR